MKNFIKGLGLGLLIGYAGLMTVAAGTMIYVYNESHRKMYRYSRYGLGSWRQSDDADQTKTYIKH